MITSNYSIEDITVLPDKGALRKVLFMQDVLERSTHANAVTGDLSIFYSYIQMQIILVVNISEPKVRRRNQHLEGKGK